MLKILIADDNVNVREAIRLALECKTGANVVGETGHSQDLIDLVARLSPDLLLLDWELPGQAVVNLLVQLRARFSSLRIMVLSSSCDAGSAALQHGADIFVCKSAPVEELLQAVAENGARET